jgi:hypothetical protein
MIVLLVDSAAIIPAALAFHKKGLGGEGANMRIFPARKCAPLLVSATSPRTNPGYRVGLTKPVPSCAGGAGEVISIRLRSGRGRVISIIFLSVALAKA